MVGSEPGGGTAFAYDTVHGTVHTWTTGGAWVFGVNDLGEAVGSDINVGTAYEWTAAGGRVTLPGMGGADGIDSTGTYVAGWDSDGDSAVYNTGTHVTTKVALGSNDDSQAWAVNRYGVVVGSTPVGGNDTAFIYANGTTYTNLAALIASGATSGALIRRCCPLTMPGRSLFREP